MPALELTLTTFYTRHLTVNAFVDAYNEVLLPGQTLVYAVGDVASSCREAPAAAELATLRAYAHRWYREGRGHLTQRRLKDSYWKGPGWGFEFEYRFTKADLRR